MPYVQERNPSPRDEVGFGRQISPYLIVDEEDLLPEEYGPLVLEAMIPVALEAEVEEPLEEGEDVIWLLGQGTDDDEDNQAEVMEDYEQFHNVEDDDDDEAYYEYTGTGNDHMYECCHCFCETREVTVQTDAENKNENQEVEDDSNPN